MENIDELIRLTKINNAIIGDVYDLLKEYATLLQIDVDTPEYSE